ncbi:MAG TPA: ABC transporter substrate-binding protein [Actinomycetes bacterium]|nr:ABC transporter substrate-binding protein [Actinomycetes bacterium]
MRKDPRRALLCVALVALVSFSLAACGGSGDTSNTGSGSSSSVKSSITVGMNNPNYATQLPVYIALDKGYFKEVGINDVKVVTSDEFVAGLVGGSIDISQGDTDQWLNAAQKSHKVVFLGTYRSKEWHILGASKDVKAPQDLVGRKVTAGQRGGRNEFVLKTMLQESGVDPAKVDFVPLGGGSDARLQALINNQVQGAVIFPRHIKPLERAGGRILYNKLTDVPQEGVATRTDFLDENRATVVAYWKATLKARQYMQDRSHQAEILQIMRSHKFEIPPDFEALYSTEIDQISPDGGLDTAKMDELVQQEQQLDILPKNLDWKQFTKLEPLWEAQQALGLPRNPASL